MNPASGMIDHLIKNPPSDNMDIFATIEALGNAAVLGMILMFLTVWVSSKIASVKNAAPGEVPLTPSDLVINSANVLFICFGMTGMMLIVNNNIARAFAIAAAIALVRFKIKVDSKVMSMSMFYGVLIGMACGVGHPYIGYALVTFFGILQLFVVYTVRLSMKKFGDAPIQQPAMPATIIQSAEPVGV